MPPDFNGDVPDGVSRVAVDRRNRVMVGVRSLPVDGDVDGAIKRIQTIRSIRSTPSADWTEPTWLNLTDKPQDTTPLRVGEQLQYLGGRCMR